MGRQLFTPANSGLSYQYPSGKCLSLIKPRIESASLGGRHHFGAARYNCYPGPRTLAGRRQSRPAPGHALHDYPALADNSHRATKFSKEVYYQEDHYGKRAVCRSRPGILEVGQRPQSAPRCPRKDPTLKGTHKRPTTTDMAGRPARIQVEITLLIMAQIILPSNWYEESEVPQPPRAVVSAFFTVAGEHCITRAMCRSPPPSSVIRRH